MQVPLRQYIIRIMQAMTSGLAIRIISSNVSLMVEVSRDGVISSRSHIEGQFRFFYRFIMVV